MSSEQKKDPMAIVVLLVGLVILGLAVWFLVNSLINTIQRNSTVGLDSEETVKMQQALVAERLKPVGMVKAGYVPKVPPPRTGKEIVADVCGECHVEGSMGAPVIGTKDWAERFNKSGFDGLLKTSQEGKGDMPPRGDDPSLTDKDLMRAIAYMLKESGVTPPVIDPPKKEGDKAEAGEGAPVAGAAGNAAPAAAPVSPTAPAATPAAPAVEPTPTMPDQTSDAGAAGSSESFDPFDLASVPSDRRGEAVFEVACKGCHEYLPPRTGNRADWQHASAKGMEALYRAALFGTFGMPPKGGRLDIADEDIKASVDYMASLAR